VPGEGNPMIFPRGATTRIDATTVSDVVYDAVIVGGGIAGAIVADELSRAGQRVLILEAGPAEDLTLSGYGDYLNRFYSAADKDNQSPYPVNPNAPMPRGGDVRPVPAGRTDAG